jgi:hypothetical protein
MFFFFSLPRNRDGSTLRLMSLMYFDNVLFLRKGASIGAYHHIQSSGCVRGETSERFRIPVLHKEEIHDACG